MDIQAIIFDFEKAPDAEARAVLCTLRKRGYRLAASYACDACDATFERSGKSSREALLSAAEMLGVAPGECAAVESDCSRLSAAKENGMTAIGVGEASTCVYADICLASLAELEDIFA